MSTPKSGKRSGKPLLFFRDSSDDRATPDWLVRQLSRQFGPFDCDPCPLNCDTSKWDALKAPKWGKCNWVNPPYSNIEAFIVKALEQRDKHGAKSVFLVPLRPTSLYWRRYVWNEASSISVFQDRVRFPGFKRKLNVALAAVVFDSNKRRRFEGIVPDTMPTYTIV
jgi:hypothetical protein